MRSAATPLPATHCSSLTAERPLPGLIPDSFIQELLARTDIVEVIGARLELKRAGREYKARSPFTNEKTPSFFVSPAKQMYFDFSSGKSGNAIGFLMDYDRLPFPEAVEELAQRAGLEVPHEGGGEPRLVLDGPLDALAAAERLFRAELKRAPQAVDYLQKRGVSGETARRYGIGYAPESWDFLSRQFPDPQHALTAGLLKFKDDSADSRRRPYDVFRNRVMFPIRDTRGRVIAFGGRALGDDPAKYLNSPETPLFHKGRQLFGLYEARQASKTALPYLLVVEGYMDAVMLAQYGFTNAVATLGTATTREHLGLLFKSTARVVFCFDGDRAGRSAAWRALEQALPEVRDGRECRFMFLPEGHDPDTLVQEIGADAFAERVAQAVPLSEFLLAELSRQADVATLDGRARLIGLARPYVQRLREGALRAVLVEELSRLSRLPREEVDRLLNDGAAAPAAPAPAAVVGPGGGAGGSRLVRRTLQLLLERPALAAEVAHLQQLADAPVPGAAALVEALEFFVEHPEAAAAQLLALWQGTPKGAALQRLAGAPLALDDDGIAREFADAITQLRRQALRARVQKLLAEAGESQLSLASQRELEAMTRELAAIETGLNATH